MKKLLCIGATHGDEPIGVEVLRRLEKVATGFDWIIGNPKAFELGTREFEGDLNRSAPGDLQASTYAKRRAAEILEQTKNYRSTIDLHGTDAHTGIFVIVTNPKKENLELAIRLGIERIVIWPSFSPELQGPLSEYFPCGVEIECGPQKMPMIQTKLLRILETFLRKLPQNKTEQTFYEVYGSLKNKKEMVLEEFVPVTIDNETFFPLFLGCEKISGVACFKLRPFTPSI